MAHYECWLESDCVSVVLTQESFELKVEKLNPGSDCGERPATMGSEIKMSDQSLSSNASMSAVRAIGATTLSAR